MSGTLLGVIALGLVVLSLFIWMNVAMVRSRSKTADKEGTESAALGVEENHPGSASAPLVAEAASEVRVDTLEVLREGSLRGSRKVFDRSDFPFVLRAASVPAFREEDWLQCFHRLTDDRRILGWIAFSEGVMGAGDREYEPGFIEVLKHHWKSLEQLRAEVGMTHIREASIVSDEGNVWILNAREDAWFALFVDGDADVGDISSRLLGPVVEP
jgi:hypothetical protein